MLRLTLLNGASRPRILGACVDNEFPIAVNSSGRVRLFLDARDFAPDVERRRIGKCDWVGDSLPSGGAVVFVVILLFMGVGNDGVILCPDTSSADLSCCATVLMLLFKDVRLFSWREVPSR